MDAALPISESSFPFRHLDFTADVIERDIGFRKEKRRIEILVYAEIQFYNVILIFYGGYDKGETTSGDFLVECFL